MLVVECIPNFSSERFVGRVAGTGACSVRFLARFYLFFLSFLSDAYVSFPYTTTSIPLT